MQNFNINSQNTEKTSRIYPSVDEETLINQTANNTPYSIGKSSDSGLDMPINYCVSNPSHTENETTEYPIRSSSSDLSLRKNADLQVSNSSISTSENSESSANSKFLEEPNIHSNFLANIELTNEYLNKMSMHNAKGDSDGGMSQKKQRSFMSSGETPCIADVNGRTSFKVMSANNIKDKLASKNMNNNKFPQSLSNTLKNVSSLVLPDNLPVQKPSLVRSKSLSSSTEESNMSKVANSARCSDNILRNNSTPDVHNEKDERNLFLWRSKQTSISSSMEDSSPSHQSRQPLITSTDETFTKKNQEKKVPTENAPSLTEQFDINSLVKPSNNNTSMTNYNCNVVDKFIYNNNFSSQPVTKSADISCQSSSVSANSPVMNTTSSSSTWWFLSRHFPKRNKSHVNHAGSAGLIMESRPKHLPAKTPEEAMLHQMQYEALIQNNKKKEKHTMEMNKLKCEAKLKEEKETMLAVQAWMEDFIPNFINKRDSKKCRDFWWKGIPSCVRGRVWQLAIGNPLNVSPHLYEMLKQRSEGDTNSPTAKNHCQEKSPGSGSSKAISTDCSSNSSDCKRETRSAWSSSWQEVYDSSHHISLDVSRTFPHLCIFQESGPLHHPLHSLLQSYVRCRPDVGYVQGMSFLAATILLNMSENESFIMFANLLNKPLLQAFYSLHQKKMIAYYRTYSMLLTAICPALSVHLRRIEVTPDLYLLDWVLSLYTRCLPLDIASRIWDLYLRDGDEFLFRSAFGVMKLYEKELLSLECTTTAAQFLTRLPCNISEQKLFSAIAKVTMPSGKKSFAELLQRHEQEVKQTSCV